MKQVWLFKFRPSRTKWVCLLLSAFSKLPFCLCPSPG